MIEYSIIVTGTPGAGKSSLAASLSELLDCRIVGDLNLLDVATVEDPTGRETRLINEEKARDAIKDISSSSLGCLIVDTIHPTLWFDDVNTVFVLLLRAHPRTIMERLEQRGWSRKKIVENVLAEAFGEIAEELHHFGLSDLTIEVDTTGRSSGEALSEALRKLYDWDVGIRIDWLSLPDVTDLVALLLRDQDLY